MDLDFPLFTNPTAQLCSLKIFLRPSSEALFLNPPPRPSFRPPFPLPTVQPWSRKSFSFGESVLLREEGFTVSGLSDSPFLSTKKQLMRGFNRSTSNLTCGYRINFPWLCFILGADTTNSLQSGPQPRSHLHRFGLIGRVWAHSSQLGSENWFLLKLIS